MTKQVLQQALEEKPCDTCSASHKNTVERVIRCGTCVAKPVGMPTNWKPKGIQKLETP